MQSKPQRTRVAAYAVLVRDDAMLLVRCSPDTHAPGQWTLPGGGIEFGEDAAHAAVREIKEETGFDVALLKLLHIDSRFIVRDDTDYHAIRILYSADVIGGELRVEVNGSTDACAWIPLDRLAQYPLVELAQVAVKVARQEWET